MSILGKILAVLGIIACIVMLVFYKKNHPELFTREAISKSFTSIGILAIALIIFVAFLVMITR